MPALPGLKVKLHTTDCAEASKMNNILEPGNVSYRGEVCMSFEAKVLSTVHVHFSTTNGISLEHGLQSVELDVSSQSAYKKCLTFVKLLFQDNHTIRSVGSTRDNDRKAQNNDDQQQTRRQLLIERSSLLNQFQGIHFYPVPTNHLTMLRFPDFDTMCVFVLRFWIHRFRNERNFFILISEDEAGDLSVTIIFTIGVPSVVSENVGGLCDSSSEEPHCRETGGQPNCMRLYMYCMTLYADDFTSRLALFPNGSVGGLQMSPKVSTSVPDEARHVFTLYP